MSVILWIALVTAVLYLLAGCVIAVLACAGPAEVFSVSGAEHGISYLVDREVYHKAVDSFLRGYVFKE